MGMDYYTDILREAGGEGGYLAHLERKIVVNDIQSPSEQQLPKVTTYE